MVKTKENFTTDLTVYNDSSIKLSFNLHFVSIKITGASNFTE